MSKGLLLSMILSSMLGAPRFATAQDAEEGRAPPPSDTQEAPPPSDTEESQPPAADDVFIPSEEVQADEELPFPVNI
jgi:hypothetical protein